MDTHYPTPCAAAPLSMSPLVSPGSGNARTDPCLLVWLGDAGTESMVAELGGPCEVVRSDYDCFCAVFSRPYRYRAVIFLPLQADMIDVIRILRINAEFTGKIWGVAPTPSSIDWSLLTDGTFAEPAAIRQLTGTG